MRDVATLAGVDAAVVSKVLSGDPRLSVREETRERVLRAVAKLDYKPNSAARSLRTSRASAHGLIIPDFHNPVYSHIIEGAQDAALEHNLTLLTASINSPGAPARKLVDVLGNGTIDGLLVAGAADPEELIQLFRARGRPVISVNRRVRGVDRYVILDDAHAAAIGVDHLVGLGHLRIAHIAGPRHSDTAERRLTGYSSAVEAAGLGLPAAFVVHADYTAAGGFEAMRRLIALDERPTAVVVANVASAIGALSAARADGLVVPRDISVIAIHDNDAAAFAAPPLTVVRMPLYELGARGIQLLQTRSADDDIREVVDGPIELVVRQSTDAPRS